MQDIRLVHLGSQKPFINCPSNIWISFSRQSRQVKNFACTIWGLDSENTGREFMWMLSGSRRVQCKKLAKIVCSSDPKVTLRLDNDLIVAQRFVVPEDLNRSFYWFRLCWSIVYRFSR